jgi:hypothetical protein
MALFFALGIFVLNYVSRLFDDISSWDHDYKTFYRVNKYDGSYFNAKSNICE